MNADRTSSAAQGQGEPEVRSSFEVLTEDELQTVEEAWSAANRRKIETIKNDPVIDSVERSRHTPSAFYGHWSLCPEHKLLRNRLQREAARAR